MMYPADTPIVITRQRLVEMMKRALIIGMGLQIVGLSSDEYDLIREARESLWADWLKSELDAAEREYGR